jgi:RNA recognition motif-containing protein
MLLVHFMSRGWSVRLLSTAWLVDMDDVQLKLRNFKHLSFFSLTPSQSPLPKSSTQSAMARRLYLGKLPPDTRSEDINKFFDGVGRIVDCRVMTGFGFVEFESSRDAEDALNQFNGKPFQGERSVTNSRNICGIEPTFAH